MVEYKIDYDKKSNDYEIGDIFILKGIFDNNVTMLIQYAAGECSFINLDSGNRLSDELNFEYENVFVIPDCIKDKIIKHIPKTKFMMTITE
jgi:hypothetical protein